MDDLLEQWAAAGLTEVTLPSGYQVRLRLPEPRDLVSRGLLPTQLIAEVLAQDEAGGIANVGRDNPELAVRLAASMQTMAADAIRQARRSEADEWRQVTVTPERYGLLPDADRERVEGLVTATLGEATGEDARATREEAAATVVGYREFRDEPGRNARRPRRGAVRPAAVEDAAAGAADGGAGGRPRARRAPRKG